jgi:hypothetical protein
MKRNVLLVVVLLVNVWTEMLILRIVNGEIVVERRMAH